MDITHYCRIAAKLVLEAKTWSETNKLNTTKKNTNVQLIAFFAAVFSLLSIASIANAQGTVRFRGTVDQIEGATYFIKSSDGTETKVVPTEQVLSVAIVKTKIYDYLIRVGFELRNRSRAAFV